MPFNATNAFTTPFGANFDANPITPCPAGSPVGAIGSRPGCEAFQELDASFSEFTGRFVVDWKINDDSLIYASYSRGYKSGGINPPLQPIFKVSSFFAPEFVNAFEVGSKNTFLDGTLRANITAFYYQYKGLQLSRIVARTSVNDNVDAKIYGVEGEFIIQPTRAFAVNIGASYLHTEVSQDKFLANPRDPSGGRADAVIIKDITNGANCAVVPRAGNTSGQAGTSAFVTGANGAINAGAIPGLQAGAGLRGPASFGADSGLTGATGAFSVCGVLGALGTAASGFEMLPEGQVVNIRGNRLPQAPEFKFSVGAQYTADFSNGWSLIPRVDIAYTGETFGNIFNGAINRIQGFTVVNAQVQLNGPDQKWYVRGFVQNAFDNNATTGLYVTDQSSGLFTNIFTLEPRRYGATAGFRF